MPITILLATKKMLKQNADIFFIAIIFYWQPKKC